MSTLSLRLEELRVQSFFIEQPALQPAEFTDAAAKVGPNSWPDCPTATGCTCFVSCFGGVCQP